MIDKQFVVRRGSVMRVRSMMISDWLILILNFTKAAKYSSFIESDLRMEENPFDEVTAIRQSLLVLQDHKTIEDFAQVWKEIGLESHHKQDRRNTIVQHIGELLEEMLNEEQVLKERMVESVRTCMQEMEQLEQELKLTTTVRQRYLALAFKTYDVFSA